MTLIVGILCVDGVAIASDRQSTLNSFIPTATGLVPTTMQTSVGDATKVTMIGQDVLIGTAGRPSIGDDYHPHIAKHQPSFAGRPYDAAVAKLKPDIIGAVNVHLQTSVLAAQALGPGLKHYADGTTECLLAAGFKDGPKLIQIERQGSFDVAKPENPLRVIGTGQNHADPFLVFLKNTFWPGRLPTVQEGVLAACWTVHYAIEAGAYGVGGGCNAYTLTKGGGKFRAAEVSQEHMQGHKDFINAARGELRKLADLRHTTPADAAQVPTMKP